MKMLVIGATGMAGSRIATEAVERGHDVAGVSRSGNAPEGVAGIAADVSDKAKLAEVVKGYDTVVVSVPPTRDGGEHRAEYLELFQNITEAVANEGVERLLVVGGAGGLEVAPGELNVDQPGFPDAYKNEALASLDLYRWLEGVDRPDWVYIAPASLIAPGERTGRYRTGTDELVVKDDGSSEISAEDFAVAVVDEAEKKAHHRERFSTGH
ncbi:NAD(P)-dependent oxidoreductase [Haloglycomyces albus]|uniref:NAD(P)-dependent oxidoreductase n=1 Tax=Haloglycomyces albus TaxID=526067 RepID=UPI00046D76E1|nr:NAD(P)H-binding protein [Haloglycomyces albus]